MKYTEPKILWLALSSDVLMASGESGGGNNDTQGGGGWDGDGSYIELPLIPQN